MEPSPPQAPFGTNVTSRHRSLEGGEEKMVEDKDGARKRGKEGTRKRGEKRWRKEKMKEGKNEERKK